MKENLTDKMMDKADGNALMQIVEQQLQIIKQQTAMQQDLRILKKGNKDIWDRLMAVGPIVSAAIIACTGAYFTYTYNLQQLKLQEIQTIEKFLPHLAGDERNKRAAILAISSLGNAKLAVKVASVFVSRGTASALTSIAGSTESSDQAIVRDALYKTLDVLAQREKDHTQQIGEDPGSGRKQGAGAQSAGNVDDADICNGLDNLADLYKRKGDMKAAAELQSKASILRRASAPNSDDVPAKSSANADEKAPNSNPGQSAKSPDHEETPAQEKAHTAKPQPDGKPAEEAGKSKADSSGVFTGSGAARAAHTPASTNSAAYSIEPSNNDHTGNTP